MSDPLLTLVEQWRAEADRLWSLAEAVLDTTALRAESNRLRRCADELAAVLSSSLPSQSAETPQTCQHRWAAHPELNGWRCVHCSAFSAGDTLDLANPNIQPLPQTPQTCQTWQPIETAPKGSWLNGPDNISDPAYIEPPDLWLLLSDGQRCTGYADAYYADGGGGYDGGPFWVELFSGERVTPTHWMPLPAPPVLHEPAPATTERP